MTIKSLFFILLAFSVSHAIDHNLWELFTTDVIDLTFLGQKMGKVGSSNPGPSGYKVYFWSLSNQDWVPDHQSGTEAIQMDFTSTHEWHLNSADSVYRRVPGGTWQHVANCKARDMKIGNGNIMWHVGSYSGGSFKAYKWDNANNQPIDSYEQAKKVGVGPDGNPWIVKDNGDIKKFDGTNWIPVPGKARDIIIGSNSVAYIISQDPADEGSVIKEWNGSSWEPVPGIGGVAFALDSQDNLYVITNENKAYRQKGKISSFCPSKKKFNSKKEIICL